MFSGILGKLSVWWGDWVGQAPVKASEDKVTDPVGVFQRGLVTLAGISALPASPAVAMLVPNINANAIFVLQVIISVVTVGFAHYVVTAKEKVEAPEGFGVKKTEVYSFAQADRIVARIIVVVGGVAAMVLWLLNFVPPPPVPKSCDLFANVTWDERQSPRPVTLIVAGKQQESYSLLNSKKVAISIPADSLSSYSISIVWDGNARSTFGEFADCNASVTRVSTDGKASISIAQR